MKQHFGWAVACLLMTFSPTHAATLKPDFSAAVFVPGSPITNPYFPLGPGYDARFSGSGIDDEGETFTESSRLSYAGPGRVILGVQTLAMRDLAYEEDMLHEATLDYYAQDAAGNVWYLGEDVTNYVYDDDGNLLSTNSSSSWIAGENGAEPGYIMPVNLTPGFVYYQEFAAADGALDQAQIWETGRTLSIADQIFEDVLVTFEFTELDPAAREFKYYAPGFGLIRADEGLDEFFANPELIVTLAPSAVPLPPAMPLMAAGLIALMAIARRRSQGPWSAPVPKAHPRLRERPAAP